MNFKRFLSLALAFMMVFSICPMQVFAETTETQAPNLPTATVTDVPVEELDSDVPLTFAKKFTAVTPSGDVADYYADWYADFELTVNRDVTFNANGSADGYLAGEYGEYSWVKVPFEDVTLKAGETLKIMEYAAELLGESGLKYTYGAILNDVGEFNCGIFFDEEFLEANPDLKVTLELRMYNPGDENETYVIGDSYEFDASDVEKPDLPTATVTEIEKEDLTFAMKFKADEVSPEQLAYYGDWYADFELTVNKDVTFNANDTADGYLAGEYGEYGWVNVPPSDVTLKAGEPLKIMEYAAELLGESGLKYTYGAILNDVGEFNCGIFFDEEFLAKNEDLEVTLELRMYNPKNVKESYTIGDTYKFTATPELPTATVKKFEKEGLTFAMNFLADEVSPEQLAYYENWYADFELTVNKEVTFDANGGKDGYLSGEYGTYGWINVPPKAVTLEAGEPLKIMEYAAELLGEPGLKYTYGEVYNDVKDFNCGVFLEEAFINANPDLEVKLELRMYNPADESETYVIGDTYIFTVSKLALPTATVKEIEKEDLTFAMNFHADEVSPEQLAYYGNWYADFELTVNKDVTFNANKTADGYLAGEYGEYSWVNVPPSDVTLKAGEPLKIMAYAAELLGEPGLKYTYGEVYNDVKDFNCGVFFDEEFLKANPDLKVTLELRMYNPFDETETYVIGDTYIFTIAPKLPTATVKEIEKEGLTFAMNFLADEASPEQLACYGSWYADFELTVNKDVTFNANKTADGYLAGEYGEYGWINVPPSDVTLEAGEPLKIMEYAAGLLGQPGLKVTYKDIYNDVKDFDCGVFFTDAFLNENPDLEVTLELRMYNPADESETYVIGDTYTFVGSGIVAKNEQTGKYYNDVNVATAEADEGETVILLKDVVVNSVFSVLEGVTFDLNGYKLEAKYVTSFGDIVDNSKTNSGLLIVNKTRILVQEDNDQLPVKVEEGKYKFVDMLSFQDAYDAPNERFAFMPKIEETAHALLLKGKQTSGVEFMVRVKWDNADGTSGSQMFSYDDAKVQAFLDSYNSSTGKYGSMFTLRLKNVTKTITFEAVVVSEFGVEFVSAGRTVTYSATSNEQVTINAEANQASALVAEGTKLSGSELSLKISEIENSASDVTLKENEELKSVDVHIEGIAADNTVPAIITVKELASVGLNEGNLSLYHVENGETVEMKQVKTLEEVNEHNEFYYDPATGDVTMALATFSEVAVIYDTENGWKGEFDYNWYDADATELTIANADQLAAFGAIVGGMGTEGKIDDDEKIIPDSFAGKTVKLLADINLGDEEKSNVANKIFYPIGYYNSEGTYEKTKTEITSNVSSFEGTFDGNGHTISNFYQNTWEMFGDYNNGYPAGSNYYKDAMGLFGYVKGGTIKNLTVDNFSSDGEFTPTGVIAAYAVNSTFENIAITNCNPRVYNTGNGGIVGIGGNSDDPDTYKLTFTNITIDNTNKITALWGSWDVACGGLVGMFRGAGHVYMTNCHVAAQIDVYNDVCGNYQYYWYRYSGMMVGTNKNMVTDANGYTVPETSKFHAKDCTVHFGDWNDYYYCELVANSLASYTHDHQFSRLEQIQNVSEIQDENGNWSKTGNFIIMNGKTPTETCYHIMKDANGNLYEHKHDEADATNPNVNETVNGELVLKENNQRIYLPFNQLFTGYGWGVKHIPVYNGEDYAFEGITILDRAEANSVVKFEKADTAKDSYSTESTVTIGELFKAATIDDDEKLTIKGDKVQVTISPVGEDSTAGGTYTADAADWTQGTLTFSGIGEATITITDYYFCTPTTITVNVTERQNAEKFETKFTGDFLYRVGNQNAVKLNSLFKAKEGAEIGTVSVTVEAVDGSSASGTYTPNATWNNGTIQFSGTGVVKVTITDNDYCIPTVLYLEVVDAVNATGATSATENNVVLLNDISGGFTVSGRYTVYGNGFTLNYTGNGQYLNNGLKQGVVTVSENGTLDNLRIEANIYPKAYLYYGSTLLGDYVQGGPSTVEGDKTRYHYQLSAVLAKGNATISNCYIYGGRNNIFVDTGDVTIKDTVLECGTVANVQIQSNASHTVTFENVTTISYRVNATIGDTTKVMLGAGILVGPETTENPKIVLNGEFKQYNWVTADDAKAVSDDKVTKAIIEGAVNATAYNHIVNDKTASNLGIIYMNEYEAPVTNGTGLPYKLGTIGIKIGGNTANGQVYSLQNATESQIYHTAEEKDKITANGYYEPQFKYDDDLGGQYIEKDSGDEHCYREGDTIYIMFPSGDTKELDLAALVNITKYTDQDLGMVITCKDSSGNAVTVTDNEVKLTDAGEYTVTYTVVDKLFYDKDGNKLEVTEAARAATIETKTYSWDVTLSVSLKDTAVPDARFEFDATKQKMGYYVKSSFLNTSVYQYLPFLAGLKIYDHNGQTEYLRFDGSTDFNKVASIEVTNKYSGNDALVVVKLTDGGVITTQFLSRADSGGGSTYTGSIKTSNNTIYFVNDGTTSEKDSTTTAAYWNVDYYKFTGNNGVAIQSAQQTFSSSGSSASTPSGSFNTTIKYTVTYDAKEGNCGQTTGYATSASAAVTLPTPTRSGYIFSGWYTAASGGTRVGGAGDSYTPSANITLYAQWGKPCTVTYNANEGTCGTASEKYTGTALTLPTPTRDGYWFTGWYDAAEGGNKIGDAGAAYNPKGDITLYAHWQEAVEYTVTYNANGGTCGTASATYQGTALTLPTPSRTGYKFLGWYTAETGGTKAGDAGASYTPSANITLYAQWEHISYTITISEQNNATVTVDKTTAHYNDTVSVTVSFSKNYSKTLTAKDASGNTVLSKSAAGTYTFTMPASNVTIEASSSDSCFTPETLVTLADGSQVRVDSLKGDEKILAWDFFEGKYVAKDISLLVDHGEAMNEVINLKFSNGTELRIVGEHGVFDYDLNKFVYITADNMSEFVGHRFVQHNEKGSYNVITLVEAYETIEVTNAYSITSAGTGNAFASEMLTVAPPEDFYNWVEMGEKMRYDVEKFNADVEKYGLYDYNVFKEYVTYEQFVDWNGAYLRIPVEKGLFSFDYIIELIELYRSYMP